MPHTRGAILRPATWTLRTKLVVAVLSLFTVVTLLVAAVTVGAVQRYLTNQLIDEVRAISKSPFRPCLVRGRTGTMTGLAAFPEDQPTNCSWASRPPARSLRITTAPTSTA